MVFGMPRCRPRLRKPFDARVEYVGGVLIPAANRPATIPTSGSGIYICRRAPPTGHNIYDPPWCCKWYATVSARRGGLSAETVRASGDEMSLIPAADGMEIAL